MNKPTASIALQVMPRTADDRDSIEIIDQVISMIRTSGVSYDVGPMETVMEGDFDTLWGIVKQAHAVCMSAGTESVFFNVKIFFASKGVMTIRDKVAKHRI